MVCDADDNEDNDDVVDDRDDVDDDTSPASCCCLRIDMAEVTAALTTGSWVFSLSGAVSTGTVVFAASRFSLSCLFNLCKAKNSLL